jgi:hypothetical protein
MTNANVLIPVVLTLIVLTQLLIIFLIRKMIKLFTNSLIIAIHDKAKPTAPTATRHHIAIPNKVEHVKRAYHRSGKYTKKEQDEHKSFRKTNKLSGWSKRRMSDGCKSYWAKMTPEERKLEMHQRMIKRELKRQARKMRTPDNAVPTPVPSTPSIASSDKTLHFGN